jgi:hypothetical protein
MAFLFSVLDAVFALMGIKTGAVSYFDPAHFAFS